MKDRIARLESHLAHEELKLDLSLEEPFEYYYNFMLSVHEVELKP